MSARANHAVASASTTAISTATTMPEIESSKTDFPGDAKLHVTSYGDLDVNEDSLQHVRDDHLDIIIGVVVAVVVVALVAASFFCFLHRRQKRQIKRAMGQV